MIVKSRHFKKKLAKQKENQQLKLKLFLKTKLILLKEFIM